jgi:hypothetical protein
MVSMVSAETLNSRFVDHRLIVIGDVANLGGYREDDVEVGHRQQLGLALLHPRARRRPLALGAVPVAAAVVGNDGMGTVLAARNVAAEGGRAAALDRSCLRTSRDRAPGRVWLS